MGIGRFNWSRTSVSGFRPSAWNTVAVMSSGRSGLSFGYAPVGSDAPARDTFRTTILDNLRKAGVKGTDMKQRITFARLDPFAGEYVHAEGETDGGAAVRVCGGPEFGTLGDADIKKAALESIKGSWCDLLLVCACAFEASVHEQTAELTKEIKLGKLAVRPVRMNPERTTSRAGSSTWTTTGRASSSTRPTPATRK